MTTTLTLYDLTIEGLELMSLLEEMEGELTPELEQRFDLFLKAGKDKINAAACAVRNLEASEKACAEEAARLTARAQMYAREAAALKHRILAAVDAGFDGKVKTQLFTIWGQTSAPTVAFDLAPDADLNQVATTYPDLVRTKHELNKTQLKLVRDNGGEIPSAITVTENEGTRYLRIK